MRELTCSHERACVLPAHGFDARCLLAVESASARRYVLQHGEVLAEDGTGRVLWRVDLNAAAEAAGADAGSLQPTGGAWLHVAHVAATHTLFCAHSSGAMVLVLCAAAEAAAREAAPTTHAVLPLAAAAECVEFLGCIDGGLVAAAWSRDQALLLLVSGACRLLILTPTWDVLCEEAVAAFAVDAPYATMSAHPSTSCAWRGDASLIALSCFDLASQSRQLRLYAVSPSGTLASGGRAVVGRHEDGSSVMALEGGACPVAWSPDGNLVALAQATPSPAPHGMVLPTTMLQVAFFEPNGLRHLECPLPGVTADSTRVLGLQWNRSGDILLVVLASKDEAIPWRVLQLWHRSNYSWALKYERRFSGVSAPTPTPVARAEAAHLVCAQWDAELPFRLHCVLVREPSNPPSLSDCHKGTMTLCMSDWVWRYCADPSSSSGGTVAAVGEGAVLRMSPLAHAQVPPPHAYATLRFTPSLCNAPSMPPFLTAIQPVSVIFPPQVLLPLDPTAAHAHGAVSVLTSDHHLFVSGYSFIPSEHANRALLPGSALAHPLAVNGAMGNVHPGSSSDLGAITLEASEGHGPALVDLLGLCCITDVGAPGGGALRLLPWALRHVTWVTRGAFIVVDAATRTCHHVYAAVASSLARVYVPTDVLQGDWLVELSVTVTVSESGVTAAAVSNARAVRLPTNLFATLLVTPVAPDVTDATTTTALVLHTSDGRVFPVDLSCGDSDSGLTLDLSSLRAALFKSDTPPTHAMVSSEHSHFPEPCSSLIAIAVPSSFYLNSRLSLLSHRPRLLTVGIGSRTGQLWLQGCGTPLSPACTSLLWHPHHALLLYVTLAAPAPLLSCLALQDLCSISSAAAAAAITPASSAIAASALKLVTDAVLVHGRALERGARLVTSDACRDAIILQAPRGNWECVIPRFVTLASLRRLLDVRPQMERSTSGLAASPRIGAALELCRRHRVDMNILYDHNPRAFCHPIWLRAAVAELALVVKLSAVGPLRVREKAAASHAADRWELLLSALAEHDCTTVSTEGDRTSSISAGEDAIDNSSNGRRARYPPPAWHVAASPPLTTLAEDDAEACLWLPRSVEAELLKDSSKVNRACAHVRAALLYAMASAHSSAAASPTGPAPHHILWQHPLALAVLTSYARQAPADLGAVLGVIQAVAVAEVAPLAPLPATLSPITADAALSHALLICDSDAELLYATALGAYDIRLALALAQRGGASDPREFVPFLAALARHALPRPGEPGVAPPAAPAQMSAEGSVQGGGDGDLSTRGQPPLLLSPASGSGGSWGLLRLPTLSPSGHLLLELTPPSSQPHRSTPPFVLSLTPGQVRLRVAIDLHLRRWPRAIDGCVALACQRAVMQDGGGVFAAEEGGEDTLRLTGDAAALHAAARAMSVSDWNTPSHAFSHPLTTALSLAFSHGHFNRLLRALGGTVPSAADVSIATPQLLRAVGLGRAWWLAAGQCAPVRNVVLASHDSTRKSSSSSAAASLLAHLAPPAHFDAICAAGAAACRPLTQVATTAEAAAALSAPLAAVLACLALHPPALDEALALASTFPGVQLTTPSSLLTGDEGERILGHVALSLAALPTISLRAAGVRQQQPSFAPLARDMANTLVQASSGGGGGFGSLAHAGRILLTVCGSTDADEGATLLAQCSRWVEAARLCAGAMRSDLCDTVLLPSLEDAAALAVTDCQERVAALAVCCTSLVNCRALRAGATLAELVGTSAAAALLDNEVAEVGGDDAPKEGEVDGEGNDAMSSVWSTAESVVSLGGRSGATSISSTSSRNSASASGVFSHFALHNINQVLANTRSSLRGGGEGANDGECSGGAATDRASAREGERTVSALRTMDRAASRRRGGGGGGRGRASDERAVGLSGARVRPGSAAQEVALEAELAALLPTPASPFCKTIATVAGACFALGLDKERSRIDAAFAALLAQVPMLPVPCARRDLAAAVSGAAAQVVAHESDKGSGGIKEVASPFLSRATLKLLARIESSSGGDGVRQGQDPVATLLVPLQANLRSSRGHHSDGDGMLLQQLVHGASGRV